MSPNQLYRWLGNRGVILRCFALRRLALCHLTLRPLFRAVICVTVRCAMALYYFVSMGNAKSFKTVPSDPSRIAVKRSAFALVG